jgi:hypothetical protein
MGLSPREVAGTSIWRLMEAYRGWRKAQGAEDKPAAPTEDEFEEAVLRWANDD